MPQIEIEYIIKLNFSEGQALKRLLGNITDGEFLDFGLEGKDRQRMSEIYHLIPYPDEED